MLRIAIQAKGRLNEQSIELLSEAGIRVAESKRKLISRAGGFPLEVLYLRDDDIPQAVAMGVADLGIVGLNEVAEKGFRVEQAMDLGFGNCRISLAVERTVAYEGLDYFRGKRVATSYPNILTRFFAEKGIDAEIHTIEGSVEIAPAVGMSDAIFDIVSSGGTLISNGLVEVEKVFYSEAVLIANPEMDEAKRRETAQLTFRFNSILESRGMKYVLMNLPAEKLQEAIVILPGMRSPTILPLAQEGRSKRRAFAAGAASGLVEPLGGLLALALAGWVSAALPWLMSLAAGCMVCVTAQEMIPEAVEADEPAGVISVVAGFALMMALDVAL